MILIYVVKRKIFRGEDEGNYKDLRGLINNLDFILTDLYL